MAYLLDILKYFFEPVPPQSPNYRLTLLIITIIILAFSIGARIILKRQKEDKVFKKLFKTVPGKLQTIAICLGIYIASRYLSIPFFSMRIVQFVIFGILIYLIARNIITYINEYPKMKEERLEKQNMNKYRPGKKKKA